MVVVNHISLFTAIDEDGDRIIVENGEVFDSEAYSYFKYGCKNIADAYGAQLAERIQALKMPQLTQQNADSVVITASAYKDLPTAAQAIADCIIDTLNSKNIFNRTGRIHRESLTVGDYSTMNAKDRAYWMKRNQLWVDKAKYFGKHVIVVDDISVSGKHAESIIEMFDTVEIASLTFVYVLKIEPSLALRDASIESRINSKSIKSLRDIRNLMVSDESDFVLNARTVKYILSQPAKDIYQFINSISPEMVERIYDGALADGYDKMNSYTLSIDCISNYITEHQSSRLYLQSVNV